MMKRSIRLLALAVLVVSLPLATSLPVTVAAAQGPECDGLPNYVTALEDWGAELGTTMPVSDESNLDEWTSEQFTAASEALAGAQTSLGEVDVPDIAAEYHEFLIQQVGILSQMFSTMATTGLFGAFIYAEQLDTIDQEMEAIADNIEATCGIALEDELDDTGGVATPSSGTIESDLDGDDVLDENSPDFPGEIGTRANPVPIGTPVALDSAWELTVLSVTPDATDLVMNEYDYNDPPAAGHQFFIATVRLTYTGETSDNFYGWSLSAVGQSAVSYGQAEDSCGHIPNELSSRELFTGGTIEGNICWSIDSADANSMVLFYNYQLPEDRIYLSMMPNGAATPAAEPPVATDSATTETTASSGAFSAAISSAVAGIGATSGDTYVMSVSDSGFDPATLIVPSGELPVQVAVTNNGTTVHSFTVVELDIDVSIEPGATAMVSIPAGSAPGLYIIESSVGGESEDGLTGTLLIR